MFKKKPSNMVLKTKRKSDTKNSKIIFELNKLKKQVRLWNKYTTKKIKDEK